MNFFEKTFRFKTYKTKHEELPLKYDKMERDHELLIKSNRILKNNNDDYSTHIDTLNETIKEKDDKIRSLQERVLDTNRMSFELSGKVCVLEDELKKAIKARSAMLNRINGLFDHLMNSFGNDIQSATLSLENITDGVNKLLGLFNGIDVVSNHGAAIKDAVNSSKKNLLSIGINIAQHQIYFENKEFHNLSEGIDDVDPDFFEKPKKTGQ